MSRTVPGRISSIVNIHNPSIEVHPVDPGINTGAAVILVAGGGHNTLNVGTEGADFVPFFYNYGVNTVILRNRLRKRRLQRRRPTRSTTRSRRSAWSARTRRSGASIRTRSGSWGSRPAPSSPRRRRSRSTTFDKANSGAGDPLAGVSSRPDFVGLVYPGPDAVRARRRRTPIPPNAPPAFITCAGSGDAAARDLGGSSISRAMLQGARARISRCTSTATASTPNGTEGSRRHARSARGSTASSTGSATRLPGPSPASRRRRQETSRPTSPRRQRRSRSSRSWLVCGCLSSRGAALCMAPQSAASVPRCRGLCTVATYSSYPPAPPTPVRSVSAHTRSLRSAPDS